MSGEGEHDRVKMETIVLEKQFLKKNKLIKRKLRTLKMLKTF